MQRQDESSKKIPNHRIKSGLFKTEAIVYNELATNAVALQNVVDQTQALHMLKADGVSIRPADLAFLSPYATSKLKRFGDYPTDLKPESMPTCMALPT